MNSILCVFLCFLCASVLCSSPAGAQNTVQIDYDAVYPLQLEYRRAIAALAEARPDVFSPCAREEAIRCTVTALRETAGWAKFVLLPTELVENDWQHIETYADRVLELVAEPISRREWAAYPLDEARARLPAGWIDFTMPPVAGAYRLPWADGLAWWATHGWHGGNALDFQPGLSAQNLRAGYGVVAANSGYLRELCWDGYQSLLQILHADGNATYYLHVTPPPRARREEHDHAVEQGAYLGEIIRFAPFNTACGRGGVRHLHFITSSRDLDLSGYPVEEIAAAASCCANPPVFMPG